VEQDAIVGRNASALRLDGLFGDAGTAMVLAQADERSTV